MPTRVRVRGRAIESTWCHREFTGLPIVLLHEGLGSIAMWRDFPLALAERTGHPVMAYSRFGHGRSDPPATPHTVAFMHQEAALLPEILDAIGIDRAILLGHSDGGSIALLAAATVPDRVDRLILEAPHVFVEDVSIASIERARHDYRSGGLRARLARYHDNVDVAFNGWNDVWLAPDFRQWNLESSLPAITCPVLLIQGEHDQYGTLRQIDAIAEQVAGPVKKVVLPDCRHSPHSDQRAAVLSAVADFL